MTLRFYSISSILSFSIVIYGLVLERAELFILLVILLELKRDDDELESSIFGSLLSTFRFSIYYANALFSICFELWLLLALNSFRITGISGTSADFFLYSLSMFTIDLYV